MASQDITVEQAVTRLRATLRPIAGVERCALAEAVGRVLAEDLPAALDVPPFANAAMDGYALRTADAARGTCLRVVGRALAGHPYPGVLAAGDAVRIMTGAAVPDGADAILMQEDARLDGDVIEVAGDVRAGMHIRPRGEHLRAGEVALSRGRRLRSYDVGLAAAAGAAEVTVGRRLRIAVLSTGDELSDPGTSAIGMHDGVQYDGNRPMLLAALKQAGYEAIDLGIVDDRADALRAAFAAAGAAQVDVLLSSGGVAQGDADFVRRLGGEFIALNIRPGRGFVHGRFDGTGHTPFEFFGLPGNPVAAYVMYRLVVAPLLSHLSSTGVDEALVLRLPLAVPAEARGGRIDWRRGRIDRCADGAIHVRPLPQQGSGMLMTLHMADALVGIGPETRYEQNQLIDVIPLDALE